MIEKVEQLLKEKYGEDTFEKMKSNGQQKYMELSVRNQYNLENHTKQLMEKGFSILSTSEILKVSPFIVLAIIHVLDEMSGLEIPESFATTERTDEELKELISYMFNKEGWTLFEITNLLTSQKGDSIESKRIMNIIKNSKFVKTKKMTSSAEKRRKIIDKVKELHEQGLSVEEIKEYVPRAEITIRQYLSKQGLKPNPSMRSLAREKRIKERRESVMELHRKGHTVKEISQKLDIPIHTVYTDIYYMEEQEEKEKQEW